MVWAAGALFLGALGILSPVRGLADEPQIVWDERMGYSSAPAPLAADVDLDHRLEIIQTGVSNEVSSYDPITGRVIWRQQLGSHTLMTPVAGHFLGNGSINVVVPTTGGRLFVLDGPTGQVLWDYDCGFVLSLPLAVFPWTEEDESSPYRQGIVLYDPTFKIKAMLIHPRRGLETVFEFETREPLAGGPVVGNTGLAGPKPHICFLTNSGTMYAISGIHQTQGQGLAVASSRLSAQGHKFELGLSLGDLNGDGFNELITADNSGYLYALKIHGEEVSGVWQDEAGQPAMSRSVLSRPTFPPVTVDVDGDRAADILLTQDKGFILINGRTGQSLWDPQAKYLASYPHDQQIVSPPSAFVSQDGTAYAVFCDVLGLNMLKLRDQTLQAKVQLGRAAVVPPLVGPLRNQPTADVYVRTNTDGVGHLVDLGLECKSNSSPWFGLAGDPSRANGLDTGYFAYLQAQQKRLGRRMENKLAEAEQMAGLGNWSEALVKVEEVLTSNPHHSQALKLQRYYFFRDNLLVIIVAALLALALTGWLLFLAWRVGKAALTRRMAQRALAKGNPARAIELLHGLCMRFPRNKNYALELAKIYIGQKMFNAQSALIFERAQYFCPEEDQYLKALATAYSSVPRFDEPASMAYSQMAQLSPKPGPWFFLLGQTLQKLGKPHEALEAYRQTIVHHHEDSRLPRAMTELYVELEITSPEVLPTLDRVFEDYQEDRGFLRVYCKACQEARRYDEKAQQVATALLAKDPNSPPAHVILATRLLQSGLHKQAMLHAQNILQVNANDSIGLRLLGACYAAEHRLDETAMKIFAKALESNPDAPEILVAVSHGFIQQERVDGEAKGLFLKALVHAPNDETILKQLANIGAHESDDDLSIRAIEPLLELGNRNRELILQLANAYCRQGIVEDKAEPIYREALVHQPDHSTIQDNLAAIYLRKERIDKDAAGIFEAAFERQPERFDLGLQLLRCYHGADRPEKALALGKRLLELSPDNADLKKLIASASEKADQMDSAIVAYEQILAENPQDKETICALSSLYGRKHRHDNAAIEVYNAAIELDARNPEHYLSCAQSYAARDSWDHVIQVIKHMLTQLPDQLSVAISLMESLVELAPKQLKLRLYLVDTQIFDGRLREAREQLMEILRINPAQTDVALAALAKILEKNPKDALANLERGRIFLRLGREQEARHAMEQAHRFHPDNDDIIRALMELYQKVLSKRESAEVRFQLGRLAMRMDKHDLAIQCFQQTSRDYRWEGEAVRNLARCFMAKGMLDLALQELKRLPVEQDVKELLYELGQRYEAVHDIQGAREVYKLIFAADITFRDVKGKLETLAEAGDGGMSAERTAIMNSLSEEAKQRYELIQELGRGAMGIVYRAHDNELDEVVALKILPDSLIRNSEAVRRFRQEARNARKLSHPHIVRIHDIGEEMGRKYISMEFVEGSDLKQKLRQCGRKLPFKDTLRYARQICEAMAYAHSIGIVHRDIKPANLMLTKDDQVKVTDFGIAKMVDTTSASPDATMAGAIIGTPLYMSPEQVKGQGVDQRADIYSMGIVFYEMASGRPPFTEGDLSYQHLFTEPKPLKNVPAEFNDMVLKCLAKDPKDRFQQAEEVLEALAPIVTED